MVFRWPWRLGGKDLDQREHRFRRLALSGRSDQNRGYSLPVAELGEVAIESRLERGECSERFGVESVGGLAQPRLFASLSSERLKRAVGVGSASVTMIRSLNRSERPSRRSTMRSRRSARPVPGR
jgi:hypothetical protein